METTNESADSDSFRTGVYHDGDEVAVRSESRYSRSKHVPRTDGDGSVVFVDGDGNPVDEDHDDARPVPECGGEDGVRYFLTTVRSVLFRDACSNCEDDEDALADRQSKGAGKTTLARLAQRSDWKGEESLSEFHANEAQGD